MTRATLATGASAIVVAAPACAYRRAVTQRDGTVFITEDADDDPIMWSGRFSAHWESQNPPRHVQGPQGVSVNEAIAWGRGRADVVLVRVSESNVPYSAGACLPAGTQPPAWSQSATVGRRRRQGMEHLDVEADSPLRWTVRLPRQLPADGFDEHSRRVADALAACGAVSNVRVERGSRAFEAVFRFSVLARTHSEALEIALDADTRTSDAAPLAVDGVALPQDYTGYVSTGWNPYDAIRPEGSDQQ